MIRPQLTEEALDTALEYIGQTEQLGEDSTALANRFLKGLIAVARLAMVHARENPQSEGAAQLHALRALI